MLNRFKSIFTPKKTRKQNLKYSPYEKRSPRNDNKEKENVNITNNEIEKSDIEVEYERPTSNAKVLIIEKDENKNDIKNDIKKIIPNETENSTEISNPKEESEITIFEKDENDKKEEKKKLNRNDEESSKSKRIKLSSFHYYGTGYSRNSQPYMPARKLQTKKSSVLFYKKILTNIAKEKPTNEIKTSIPEISQTAKLILDVVEKEEKKYKKPMKMKKLEKKSSPSKSTDTEKKLNNNDLKLNSQNIKKTELLPKKRIAPINISGPKSSSQFNFVRQSSSYASHPEIVNLSKTLSSENSELPIFTFERKSSSYSFDNSTSEDKKSKEINKTESETSISKPITGFNWAAAGMKKPTLAADEWKCSVCDAKNKNDADKCVCCEEPNPNKKASDKPKEAPKFTFGGSSSITFGKPAAESTETKTSVSFGNVTDTKPTSTGFDWAAAGMKKPTLAADEWKCSVCDAKNKNDADKCICCEEPNPNKKTSDKPKEAPKFTFGGSSSITFGKPAAESSETKTSVSFGNVTDTKSTSTGFDWAAAGMKKPTLAADEWKCSVCDAKNKNDADKCICCEEPNPNKKTSDKPKEAPKFTFGGSSSITFGKPAAESSETKTSVSFGNVTDAKSTSTGFDWAAAGMKKPTLAADEWKCSVCDAKNKNDADKCVCCEEPNPNKKASDKPKEAPKFTFGGSSSITFGKPAAESTETKTSVSFGSVTDTKPTSTGFDWAAAGMKKPTLAADEWKCSVCDAKNKNDADKCICCEEPNPNKKAFDKPKEAPKFTFGGSSSITFGKPAAESSETKTSVSFGNVTDTKSTSTGFDWAAAGMKKPTLAADEWKCSVCDAKNKNDADKCICCEEPNPNKKTSDKPKEAPKFTFGGSSSITFGKPAAESTETKTSVSFGNVTDTKSTSTGFDWAAAGMKKPTLAADEWKCSVCDAKNKNDADKCICCEEPNPNKKASDKSKEAPKFTFGSNSSSITFGNTTGSTISFGQPSTTTTTASTFGFGKPFTSNASSNPISFGSTTTTSSTSKPVGFSFNSTTTNSNTKTTTTGFSFTTSNTTSTSNTFGSSTTMFNTTTTPNNTFSAFSFGNKTNNSNTDPQNK